MAGVWAPSQWHENPRQWKNHRLNNNFYFNDKTNRIAALVMPSYSTLFQLQCKIHYLFYIWVSPDFSVVHFIGTGYTTDTGYRWQRCKNWGLVP